MPRARPGKDDRYVFPGYHASSFGRLVMRVAGIKVTDLRSLVQEELRERREEYKVPKALLTNFLGQSEVMSLVISAKHEEHNSGTPALRTHN